MSHGHMVWCFVKGFGTLTLGVGVFVFCAWLIAKLMDCLADRFGWDIGDMVVFIVLGLGFLAIGTVISLSICGVIK